MGGECVYHNPLIVMAYLVNTPSCAITEEGKHDVMEKYKNSPCAKQIEVSTNLFFFDFASDLRGMYKYHEKNPMDL